MAGKREQREAQLKLEAARQLRCGRGGKWLDATVNHVCGDARALEVIFTRGDVKFDAKLLDGEIVELEAFPSKAGKA